MSARDAALPAHLVTRLAAGLTAVIAGLVLVGCMVDSSALTTVISNGTRMAAPTALTFLLGAVALALIGERRHASLAQGCAYAVLLIGLLRLSTALLGGSGAPLLDEMPLPTAFNFTLLGASLAFSLRAGGAVGSQTLAIITLLGGWLGLARYVYGAYQVFPYTPMAIHSAVLFMTLGAGVIAIHRGVGLMRLLGSRGLSGSSMRGLLPAVVILPLALAFVPAYAEHAGWLGRDAGLVLFALANVVFFGLVVGLNAAHLERSDARRRRAEEELHATQERAQIVLENAIDAVVTMDSAGRITGWNSQAEATFGWTKQEAIGRSLAATIVPGIHREAHEKGLARFLTTGEAHVLNKRIELSALHRDGHEFPVELSIASVKTGDSVGFSAFVRDITARKRDLAELNASRERMRTLTESLPNLVWTCRPDGTCDYLSRQWCTYTGRPEAEQLGFGWVAHVHPEDRSHIQAAWTAAVSCGSSYDVEFRIRRADGAYRWFRTRAFPFRDAAGEIVQWFGSNTDIEDYKISERLLRTQLERMRLLDRLTRAIADRQDTNSIFDVVLRTLEENMPIDFGCICLCDASRAQLTVTSVGRRSQPLAERLSMRQHATIDIEGSSLTRGVGGELVHDADLTLVSSPLAERLAGVGLGSLVLAPLLVESKVFGVVLASRKGTNQFNNADSKFLRQVSEHVALVMHQADLYGALQLAYDDLRETQEKVMQQERLRTLGQLASGVAHDVNNALSPAALYAQTLLRHDMTLSKEAREYLGIIQRAIEGVASTVTRMKEFCRPRESDLAHTPVDLNKIVEQVLALTHARWHDMPQERGVVVKLVNEVEPKLPHVMGAEAELRDGVTNLVLNAVDAMPDGGTLTVRTRNVTAGHVALEVSDTGIGMDEDTRTRCIEPFFTTKGEQGTGLGLAMVYGMLERHSGGIEIDSERGKGTTMRLVFPVSPDLQATDLSQTMTLRLPQQLRLLLIDDDPMVLRSLQAILLHEGHAVTAADGGENGIAAFRTAEEHGESFSLVITDLGMPHIDGRKVAAAVKAIAPHVPVMLLTGWGHRMQAEGETPEYVDRVLSKPPKLAELRRALSELTQAGAPGTRPHKVPEGTAASARLQ